MCDEKVRELGCLIRECVPGGMVFFGGAGVSTESGIPDFRSSDGLYTTEHSYAYPPEVMLSHSFFVAHPAEFFEFYFDKMVPHGVKPNAAHLRLAELEAAGTCRAVVTQNIDGLHQAAGSKNVLELHGSIHRNHCMDCGRSHALDQVLAAHAASADGVPRCSCGGIIKPDVVLYEEALDEKTVERSVDAIAHADLLLIAGTSLSVYPAAGLIRYFSGSNLVIVNRDPTPGDSLASLCIHDSVGKVLDAALSSSHQ